jgi:hypothetical protein
VSLGWLGDPGKEHPSHSLSGPTATVDHPFVSFNSILPHRCKGESLHVEYACELAFGRLVSRSCAPCLASFYKSLQIGELRTGPLTILVQQALGMRYDAAHCCCRRSIKNYHAIHYHVGNNTIIGCIARVKRSCEGQE